MSKVKARIREGDQTQTDVKKNIKMGQKEGAHDSKGGQPSMARDAPQSIGEGLGGQHVQGTGKPRRERREPPQKPRRPEWPRR